MTTTRFSGNSGSIGPGRMPTGMHSKKHPDCRSSGCTRTPTNTHTFECKLDAGRSRNMRTERVPFPGCNRKRCSKQQQQNEASYTSAVYSSRSVKGAQVQPSTRAAHTPKIAEEILHQRGVGWPPESFSWDVGVVSKTQLDVTRLRNCNADSSCSEFGPLSFTGFAAHA